MATLSADIAIVGGGLCGLYLAVLLEEQGRSVKLFEASPEAGGVIRSSRHNGFLIEHGPNSTLLKPAVEQAVFRLGLEDKVIRPAPEARHRYLGRELKGPLTPLPTSPLAAVRSPILSPGGKLRLLREPFVRKTSEEDQSVADFFSRRFGKEVTEELVAPIVNGIWAADINFLSVRTAFPRIWELAQTQGSVLGGLMRKRRGEAGKKGNKPEIISFTDGMKSLPEACALRLKPETVVLQQTVKALTFKAGKARLEFDSGREAETFNQVVLCCPAAQTAALLAPSEPRLAEQISAIPYAPIGIVHFAVEWDGLNRDLDGYGFLVPPNRNQAVLGAIFSSSLFEDRAPEGFRLLTCMSGGAVHPAGADVEDAAVLRQVEAELARFIGARKPFHLLHKSTLKQAIPNYPLGHHRLVNELEKLQGRIPELHILGNWLRGISVADRLEEAERAAESILRTHPGQRSTALSAADFPAPNSVRQATLQ